MNNFWNRGPREWSPRLKRGLRIVRQLHNLFPKYMLQPYGGPKPGHIRTLSTLRGDEEFILTFVVTFEKEGSFACLQHDGVWISPEGVVDIGPWIRKMLKEGIPFYPELAGRWPWPEDNV